MRRFIFSLVSLTLPFGNALAEQTPQDKLAVAEAYYQKGDCARAVPLYRDFAGAGNSPEDARGLARFRGAYCSLAIGEFRQASDGFSEFLSKYPGNHEARLKRAEALFGLADYRGALSESAKVSAPWDKDARILGARSAMELGEYEVALAQLGGGVDPRWAPVYAYWRGVAYYGQGEEREAIRSFTSARDRSPGESWVRSQASAWLEQLNSGGKRLSLRLTPGFYYDGNIAQSAYTSIQGTITDRIPTAVDLAAPVDADYVKDRGYSLDGGLDYQIVRSRKFWVTGSLAGTVNFYQNQTSYNQESLTARLETGGMASRTLRLAVAASFLDVRYKYLYYQEYAALNPWLAWELSRGTYLGFSGSLTRQVVTRPGWLLSPSLSLTFGFLGFSSTLSTSFSRAIGEGAVIKGSADSTGIYSYVESGTEFSRYSALSPSYFISRPLPLRLSLGGLVSYTLTRYDPVDLSNVLTGKIGKRDDRLLSTTASLSVAVVERLVSMTLSYTYSKNVSNGFQGTTYTSGYSPNYNYTRSYALLALTATY